MASQPLAVKLQYMRKAPLPAKATKMLRSPEEAISMGESFLISNSTASHFKLLDDEGKRAEDAAIADARRRVLEQRKYSKRHVHMKAWGAPPVDSTTLKRSITPRSHPGLKRDKEVTSYGRNNIDLELMPDVWDNDGENNDDNNNGRGSPSPVRLKPQQTGRVPYDFVDNLKKSKKQAQRDGQVLEEAYSSKKPYDNEETKVRGSPNHIKKWADAVRDTYIRDDSRSPSPEQKRRPKTAPSNSRNNSNRRSRDKRPWKGRKTVPEPFAGLEARATIQRKSLSQIELEKELQRKEEAVMAEMKVRFKPVPIPRSTTERRYEALLEKMEAIRIENHAAAATRLKANEKPFVGMMKREKERAERAERRKQKRLAEEQKKKAEMEAEKKARKLKNAKKAASAIRAAELHASKEVERKARIARRAEKLMSSASMPARMEKWEMTEGLRKKQEKLERERNRNSQSSRGKKSSMSANQLRESFQRSQKRFKERIQQAKAARPALKPQPFSFLSEERINEEKAKKKAKEEKIKKQMELEQKKKHAKENRLKELAKKLKSQPLQDIRGTAKTIKCEELVKKRMNDEMKKQEAAKRLENEKHKKMKETSKEITKEIQKRINEMPKAQQYDPKERARQAQESMKANLKRLRDDVARAVENRVYLFDQHKLQKRKEQARRAALEKVGAAVFKSNDGNKKGWKKNARVDKSGIFNNEEKEDMEVYDEDDYGDDFED
jgi:hypothetical protein